MAVQYSIQRMVSDGTLSTIALGIQYLQRNDIYIRIAGEETPQSGAPSGYTWSFLDNTTLKILPVVPNGVEVVVYRRTDVDTMYNIYSQNAQFDEATIDENNQQLLYIAQEYLEQGIPGAGVDTIEFLRDDGSFTYYRMRRTDGSYSEEFSVPSASSSTKVLTREALRRSYAEAGYNVVGTFQAGFAYVNANDVGIDEVTGKGFTGPAGPVAAGTDPTSGGFVDRSEATLRQELRDSNSYVIADWFELETDTDGASCINRALELVRAKGGGIVQLLGRIYTADNQILIPEKCHLRGAGIDVSVISASVNLAKELNIITTKNNPMYTFKCTSLTGAGSGYTYIHDVHVSDLTVLGNHVTRAPNAASLAHVEQGCGIRYTSVIGGSIKRVRVHQPVVHGISVDASAYFDDGDYTHKIAGGSRDVLVEDCIVSNALVDDCITTHNSNYIVFNRCTALNDGTDPNMQWANNHHGIEIDEGSEDITVLDCKATNLICGFQAKGHDTTYAARRVKFVRCHAKNCVWSFITDHFDTMNNLGGGGEVSFIDCTSETPLNDKYQTSNPTYRPRHMWLRSYDGITIRGLTLKGPGGIVQFERGVRNVKVSDVKHTGGYSGFDAGTTGVGLFLIVSNSTKGGIFIEDVTCRDAMTIPIVMSGDSTIRRISLSNISAPMSVVNMPLILINSQSLPTINRCYVAGSSTVVVNMPNLGSANIRSDVAFSLNNGFADIIGGIDPSGGASLFPAVVGWTYRSWNSGDMWLAKGSGGMQTIGTWKLVTSAT